MGVSGRKKTTWGGGVGGGRQLRNVGRGYPMTSAHTQPGTPCKAAAPELGNQPPTPCTHGSAPALPHTGKGPSKDTGTPAEQQFVKSVIELHDKYLVVSGKPR